MALPLKWYARKPIWIKQYYLTKEKLQAFEQLLQEQLKNQAAPEMFLNLLLKRNMEDGEW